MQSKTRGIRLAYSSVLRSNPRTARSHLLSLQAAASFFIAILICTPGFAQQTGSTASGISPKDASLDEVVVTGTRRATASPADSPAPVQIIGAAQLTAQPSEDINDVLRNTVPSLNVNDNPLSGTSTSIRPASLRGLSPDQTLILVNGKRRHRAADIATFSGGISDGSQGPDLASIPVTALKQVQVLRDGASAQYGSDAIAGVINFILDNSTDGGHIGVKAGGTYAGDGANYEVQAAYGVAIAGSGFFRFTAEYGAADATTRSVELGAMQDLLASGNTHVPSPPRWGTPKVWDNLKTFVNMEVPAGDNSAIYGFGGYSQRKTASDFFYRGPNARGGVFTTSDDGGDYLIGNMNPNGGTNCGAPVPVNAPNAAALLAAATSNPNCFAFVNVLPGGYVPLFGSSLTDISGTLGLRGKADSGMTYDVSFGTGRDSINFNVMTSPNPSLGSASPLNFGDLGTRIQLENVANLDLAYPLNVPWFASPLNLAGGLEWHREEFQILPGQLDSYQAGILSTQGFTPFEEAYPGYSPQEAGDWQRHNVAVYVDLDADVTEDLRLAAATRYEKFNDMGSQVTYKLSGIYHLTHALGFRATYATGFHAPSPGQEHFTAITSEVNALGNLIDTGVIPPTSPVAHLVGAPALRPETADSLSVGMVVQTDPLNVTVDAYQIKMKHRLTQSASYTLTAAQRAQLIAQGDLADASIGDFRFFTNDFASTTRGVDVVASIPLKMISRGSTTVNVLASYVATDVTSYNPNDPNNLLSPTRVIQLEENLPKWKGNISLDHVEGRWRGTVRGNYYGAFTELHLNSGGLRIDAGARGTLDLEGGFRATDKLEFSAGVQNVLNRYPTVNPWGFIAGSKYPTTSPYGVNGGIFYGAVKYNF